MDGNAFLIKKRSSSFPKKNGKKYYLIIYSTFIRVYIDDMLICFDNEKDHEEHLNTS